MDSAPKEFINVDFIIEDIYFASDIARLLGSLVNGVDLIFVSKRVHKTSSSDYVKYSMKITKEYATFLKLQHEELANRMQVFQISDDLKDKFRCK